MTRSGRRLGGERGEERRDLGRVVLAVGVERQDRVGAVVERPAEAGPERGALALVRPLLDDGRAGLAGPVGRVVGRAVVDDDDRQVLERAADDGARSAAPSL